MSYNNIVNIINFVRGVEPRTPNIDLIRPVIEELKLNEKYGFSNTFLLQYDAMINVKFQDVFLNEKCENMEIGIWIEIVQPLVEAVGIEWRGREGYSWDWHVNPGFLMAYTKEEKHLLIDQIIYKFKEIFGYYPKSAGCWLLDSDSMKYMSQEYNMDAFCICREQWGTDGYTLWGGYYNGGYYPCKNNMLIPAQTKDEQINTPVFRMLGADPIYCYYEHFKEKYNKIDYSLFTLEPSWKFGQCKDWVKWYFRNTFENENLGFSYTQMGQENSFSWDNISNGLPMQMEYLFEQVQQGKVCVNTLGETGRLFKKLYKQTPATAISALDDWADNDNQSVWYNSKNYRINIFSNKENLWIRDIHKFDEQYRDVYLDNPCMNASATYDALPIIDGLRFSDDNIKCGLFLGKGKILSTERETDALKIILEVEGKIINVLLYEDIIKIRSDSDFTILFQHKANCTDIKKLNNHEITYEHNGFSYRLRFLKGKICDGFFESEDSEIVMVL